MQETALYHELYINAVNTIILVLLISIVYIALNIIFVRKAEGVKHKKKIKIRVLYICTISFMLILARIWVEGFTHLFAVLGLVSAALVVTNKETIMNITAWSVIQWRSLFSENDLIQIQHYRGYVKSIGLLYVTLAEVTHDEQPHLTGKIIKLPNGLTTNNPITNYSLTSHIILQHLTVNIVHNHQLEQAKELLRTVTINTLHEYYKSHPEYEYSARRIRKKDNNLSDGIEPDVEVSFSPKFEKPVGFKLTVRYYCFLDDSGSITQLLWSNILKQAEANSILIAYEN